jgi:hypothetical protein
MSEMTECKCPSCGATLLMLVKPPPRQAPMRKLSSRELQDAVIALLREDSKREVYEAMGGGYYVTYSGGVLPQPMSLADVKSLVQRGWIVPKMEGLYVRGPMFGKRPSPQCDEPAGHPDK